MAVFLRLFKRKKDLSRKDGIIELVCTVLSCWLLALATALISDSQFTIRIGVWTIIWQTLAVIVAIALMTRRWWIIPLCIITTVPLFLFVLYLKGDFTEFFKTVWSFLKWWSGGLDNESDWYTDKSYYIIHTLMNIGITVLYFAIARITKRAWISVLVALCFLGANFAYGYTQYSIITIPILVVAIFPLLASEKFQRIKRPDFSNVFGIRGKKWLMVAVSTFIAILVAGTSLFVINNTKGSVRTRFCTDIVTDLQTATDVYLKEQERTNITLFNLGLAKNSTFVGGNIPNMPSKILATTNLTKPTRVKLAVFDVFDGQNWVSNFEKTYRINSPFWKEEQKNYLASPQLDNANFMDTVNHFAKREEITFNLKVSTNFLPTVEQTLSFKENRPTKNPITFDSRGRLISFYPQAKKFSYTVESLSFDTLSPDTESQMNAILGSYSFLEDPNYNKKSEFYKHYTKPLFKEKELPQAVTNAIKKYSDAGYNEYQKAYMISILLSNTSFSYTEKPGSFEKGENILKDLFEYKRGHCVYYATAMVAIARECGIPSRLAAGYVTVPGANRYSQVIDTSSPYAWTECYIPNIGWISFDPSPKNMHSVGGFYTGAVSGDSLEPTEEEKPKEEENEVGGTDLEWSTNLTKMLPLIILAAMVLIALIALVVHTATSQGYYKLKRVRKRYDSTEKQAKFYYADILRQFRWLGFKLPRGKTVREGASELACAYTPDYSKTLNNTIESIKVLFANGELPNKQQIAEIKDTQKLIRNALRGKVKPCDILKADYFDTLMTAVKILEALYYGGKAPSNAQIEQIFKARESLEVLLKSKNNVFMYTIKRRMLLPIFTFKTMKKR